MKPLLFVCLFAIFISTIVLAQSNPVPVVNQPNALPTAQQRHPALSPNLSQMPPAATFAQRRSKGFKAALPPRGNAPTSGLNFAPVVTYGVPGAISVAFADVNGDGKPDLLVVNPCADTRCINGAVDVLLGNGDGTFQAAVSYGSGGYNPFSVAVADVNRDGNPDLVVANPCSDSSCSNSGLVGVLLGNGDGTFQPVVTFDSGGSYTESVAVADLNGDGKPDIVVANACFSCGNDGSVGVLLGNGDGTFQTAVTYNPGGYNPISVAVADVNGDGKPDVVVANMCDGAYCGSSPTVGVLLNNGDGTFQTAVSYGPGGYDSFSVAVADLDGDGKPDIVVANLCADNNCTHGSVGVLLGNGDGTFQTAVAYDSGDFEARSIAVADVNGDGKPDLVVANECASSGGCSVPPDDGSVGVLLGNGDGTFQTAVTYDSGGYISYSIAVADVNGDGKPDLVVANLYPKSLGSGGSVGVLINTSTYPTTTALGSSANPSAFGQSVTFTATVTQQFGKGTPTGTVTFLDGTINLGSPTLSSSGVTTLTISTLAVGTHSITATYNGDSNFGSSTSPVLSQVVQGAIVTFSQSSLNFGSTTVGTPSAPQSVTLTNSGNITLAITSIVVSVSNGSYTHINTCRSTLSAGASCMITLTWTPGIAGNMTGSITITDNAPGSPQAVSLSGVGVVPAVTLSPTSLTFATQVVFTTSAAQSVTLTNTGLGNLSITKISVAGSFTQTNTCGTQVAAGGSCTFNVKFKPTTSGMLTGSVSITDNASGSPQKITLTGTGTDVQLTPTSLNFGNQPVGTKSAAKKVTLSNKASVTVSITSISITGTSKGDFAETNTCGTSVKAGASCSITVTFTPAAKGKRTARVSVSDNGGGSPQTVGLSGTGT